MSRQQRMSRASKHTCRQTEREREMGSDSTLQPYEKYLRTEMKRFECCTDKSASERERLTAAPALHSHAAIHTHAHAHTHLQTVINHFSLIFLVFLLLNLLSAIAQEYVYTPTHLSVYVCLCVCLLGCANSNNDVPRHGVKYLCNNNNYIKRKLQIKRITKESFHSAGLKNTLLRMKLRGSKVSFCRFDCWKVIVLVYTIIYDKYIFLLKKKSNITSVSHLIYPLLALSIVARY